MSSNIPLIQRVIDKTVPDYIVEGKITPLLEMSYLGAIVPVIYANGIIPEKNQTALMTRVNNVWYVIATVSVPKPVPVMCWHGNSNVIVGGAIGVPAVSANYTFNVNWNQTSPANGNSFTQSVYLVAGEYSFTVCGTTTTTMGKSDWYLDNTLIVSGQDWYSGATAYNIYKTNTIYVPYTGVHEIKSVINGKNASSSNYILQLTYFAFIPN